MREIIGWSILIGIPVILIMIVVFGTYGITWKGVGVGLLIIIGVAVFMALLIYASILIEGDD